MLKVVNKKIYMTASHTNDLHNNHMCTTIRNDSFFLLIFSSLQQRIAIVTSCEAHNNTNDSVR